ncbi:lytic polysaccharide monooxygenase auxiliary activity family 9 protein [Rhizomonospora bruguierae]|uniref:lytic polysaccharide monooxygenase auxiliary activity family 9 protein n=1 Tax=Rhizomonospora bruguierae TaxID=1581705 RepID=UPI001BCD7DF4|nr:lytic polysaccharide monooxygenase [Micromonospora sp. NBRC 107566]
MTARRLTALAATLLLALAVGAVVAPAAAPAHGTPQQPGSRTWLCYLDGLSPQGDIQPHNPACSAAVAQGGTTPLYNWFGVLRSDANGRTTGFVPDGQLCSGGNPTFAAYDLARSDWPVTHVTAGAQFEIDYSNWAKHPGTFYVYVTRDTWSPTRPLAWSDLEAAPFSTVTDPPQVGGPGTNDGHYYWTVTLPAGKTGRHLIYARWVRSDSQENFFSCSDVVFDGGTGQVTGVGTGSEGTPQPGAPGLCTAVLEITNSWPGGFQGEVTVTAGSSGVSGWTTSFSPGSGATITQAWNGVYLQSGTLSVVRNESWNRQLTPHGSATYGFVGSGTVTGTPAVTCTSP